MKALCSAQIKIGLLASQLVTGIDTIPSKNLRCWNRKRGGDSLGILQRRTQLHTCCAAHAPPTTPSEIQERLLRKNGSQEQDATAATLILVLEAPCLKEAVGKRASGPDESFSQGLDCIIDCGLSVSRLGMLV